MESSLKSNFLIIDPQARGHALSYLLAQSDDIGSVYLSRHSPLPDIGDKKIIPIYWLEELSPTCYPEIIRFCQDKQISCVVVGTADAMAMGLVDSLQAADIPVLGANKQAICLESSKAFSKAFFRRHAIPTPLYQTYYSIDEIRALEDTVFPCFIKSDQIIRSHYSAVKIDSKEEALEIASGIFAIQRSYYGHTGSVILEQFNKGREVSFTILMGGGQWRELPASRDYKTLLDGDNGSNTSGMGAISPVIDIDERLHQKIISSIVKPVVDALLKEGLNYNGILYLGIIIGDNNAPTLLELNCRLGDPEAQAICLLLTPDFSQILLNAAYGRLDKSVAVPVKAGYVCCVYAVPVAYPNNKNDECNVVFSEGFNAGNDHQYYFGELSLGDNPHILMACSNRMFSISAWGKTLAEARQTAYQKLNAVVSSGLHYRQDIGMLSEKGDTIDHENI